MGVHVVTGVSLSCREVSHTVYQRQGLRLHLHPVSCLFCSVREPTASCVCREGVQRHLTLMRPNMSSRSSPCFSLPPWIPAPPQSTLETDFPKAQAKTLAGAIVSVVQLTFSPRPKYTVPAFETPPNSHHLPCLHTLVPSAIISHLETVRPHPRLDTLLPPCLTPVFHPIARTFLGKHAARPAVPLSSILQWLPVLLREKS